MSATSHPTVVPRLTRGTWSAPVRPVRVVHLGIGNFSRAHQAWYSQAADDERQWGIAAFTGRRPDVADALAPQQGLFTLIERGPVTDRLAVIDVLQDVRAGDDLSALAGVVSVPRIAVVTLTLTEAAYAETGSLNPDTALGRLVLALQERHRRAAPPLAIVSCDNLAANGTVLRQRLIELADGLDSAFRGWLEQDVSYVTTSVDRVTPRATEADRRIVSDELGRDDRGPVVCEPFTDWVLCGEFPAGRPPWERAGARFVTAIEPWERRKLWLLNGGHCLLAYLGIPRGYTTVAEATTDRELMAALERFWDLAERYLPAEELGLAAYRHQLRERFANARISYPLSQIAGDGLDKLRNRVVPVIMAATAAGDDPAAATAIVTAWIEWLLGDPGRLASDQNSRSLKAALAGSDPETHRQALADLLAPGFMSSTNRTR